MHLPLSGPGSNHSGLQIRKLLGRSYLRDNRLEEGVDVFLSILNEEPEDVDAWIVMANLYQASGCPATARWILGHAKDLSAGNLLIHKQLERISGSEPGCQEETDPLSTEAVGGLILRLRQQDQPGVIDQIREAADALGNFLPGGIAGEDGRRAAGEMQQLMPALIEINVRHARASGQTDLAQALQSLHNHLTQPARRASENGEPEA
jgi:hypothetical protein